jgi:diguanylate cyclase (GGDEF)-like protein/PAS domain S-box-containing protein
MTDRASSSDYSADIPSSWGLSLVFIRYAVYLVLLAVLSFLSVLQIASPDQTARVVSPFLLVLIAGVALLLMWRGMLRPALATLVWASWAIVTGVLVFYGGVHGTPVVIYPLLVMLAGWLLGTRSAIILAALSATVTLALVLAEQSGVLPAAPATSAALYGVVQVWCVLLTTFVIVFLVRSYTRRLREVHKLSLDLALRSAEAQHIAADLNVAQSVARIGSWVYVFANDEIVMSPEACRIFGVPEGTRGTRRGYLKRVHPDDRPGLNRDWEKAVAGAPLLNEHRIRIGQANRWICQRARIEFDAGGKPLRCVGTTQDISESKRAEEEMRIAATAFEAQEGMVITDARRRILRVNQAFTRITGYALDEVAGQSPSILKSGRHDAAFYSAMWAGIKASGSWQGEIWNRRKNGEVYPEWLTISAVTNASGTVTHYVGTLTDITLRKAAEDEIKHLAFYDPLTRLPNRRLLLDRLQQALAASTRSGRQGALLFLDLDHFKELNDSEGHDQGDLLLQLVAQRLSTCVREGDTVARFGGDEFVIMLVDLSTLAEESATQAETVGQKISVALSLPFDIAGHPYRTSASIGITLFSDHQATPLELLRQADLAMYEAKAAGRNTVCFFSAAMQLPSAARARRPS